MREYFVNADFDLSLRPRRPAALADARSRQAAELPMHLLLLGTNGDSILSLHAVDERFPAYLSSLGLPEPSIRVLPSISETAEFTPFGWNAEAAELNDRYPQPSGRPDLEVVRRVNGRRFAAEVERRHFGDRHVVGVCRTIEELDSMLSERSNQGGGWLVKSEHGNGGFGNRRVRSRALAAADRKAIARFLVEDERVVVEVWRRRLADLASVFEVDGAGELRNLLVYEVVNTADGAFIGDVFASQSPLIDRWVCELEEAMQRVAEELAAAGYTGPVCVDSFVWDDRGVETLRPVVDVNARLSVSAAAERLWSFWGRDRVVYWRLFSARKLKLPETPASVFEALGDDAFDPGSREGVLLTSPLVVDGRHPRRLGVVLAGRDRRSVEGLDRRFRRRFEK